MTTDTLAKLAADLEQLASKGPAIIRLQSGAYICQKLSEAAKALAAQATTGAPSEPFGYFKAEPFGWTDCAEDDDGAVALYEGPQQAAQATAGWVPIGLAPKDGTNIWAFNGEQGVMHWIDVDVTALWVWEDDLLSDADPEPIQPTHWQPLPAPPTALPQPPQPRGDTQ